MGTEVSGNESEVLAEVSSGSSGGLEKTDGIENKSVLTFAAGLGYRRVAMALLKTFNRASGLIDFRIRIRIP